MNKNSYFSIQDYNDYDLDEYHRHDNESIENVIDELLGLIESEKNTVKAKMVYEKEKKKVGQSII